MERSPVSGRRAPSLFLSLQYLPSSFHEAFMGLCSGSEAHRGGLRGTGISRAEREMSCGGNQHPNNLEREEQGCTDSAGREGGPVCSAVALRCRPSPGAHMHPIAPHNHSIVLLTALVSPCWASYKGRIHGTAYRKKKKRKKEKANIHLLP